jgi:hypothetical protein
VPDEPKSGAVPADPLPGEDPFADATPRAELVIGDCLTVVLVRISCDQSHSYEVFRIIDHPALDISPYPDREALRAIYSHQDNIDAFHAYLGSDVGADGWVAPLISPDAEEWAAGDRLMLSLVSNTRTPDYLMTGSARGVLG